MSNVKYLVTDEYNYVIYYWENPRFPHMAYIGFLLYGVQTNVMVQFLLWLFILELIDTIPWIMLNNNDRNINHK
jgi:hypothetical protein